MKVLLLGWRWGGKVWDWGVGMSPPSIKGRFISHELQPDIKKIHLKISILSKWKIKKNRRQGLLGDVQHRLKKKDK